MKILKILSVALLTSACVAEYNTPSHMRIMSQDSAGRSYAVSTSNEVARVGETSQRFEIRHGDCGNWDCNNDRRRIEVNEYDADREARVGDTRWYGWSIYLPNDFRDLNRTTTTVGQAKLLSWRGPLWDFNAASGVLYFEYRPQGRHEAIQCRAANLSNMRGRWTDVVVFSDFGYQNTGQPMVQVWINGRLVCSDSRPLVTETMVREAGKNRITFRYGIYNSYVSRWLNANRTQSVATSGFSDYHTDSGGTVNSVAARPFDIDWGVELPTQVVFYDEVRIGRSREQVDVRMRD